MKKFKFTADSLEKVPLFMGDKEDAKKDQRPLFEQMLMGALRLRFKGIINAKQTREHSRILNKLDFVKGEYLELEEAEFDLLKAVFCDDMSACDPVHTRLIAQYVKNIEDAQKTEK